LDGIEITRLRPDSHFLRAARRVAARGANDTPETEPIPGNPCESARRARCFEASVALVLPTGDAWTAFFRP